MPESPLKQTLKSDAEVDAWLGWVDRTYGLASCSVDKVAGGFAVVANLKEQSPVPAGDEGSAPPAEQAPASPTESPSPAGSAFDELAELVVDAQLDEMPRDALVDLLERVRGARASWDQFEDLVLQAAHEKGASLRMLAAALQVGSPEGVAKRLRRLSSAKKS